MVGKERSGGIWCRQMVLQVSPFSGWKDRSMGCAACGEGAGVDGEANSEARE